MPAEPFVHIYERSLLKCAPTPLANGRWAPRLIVVLHSDKASTEAIVPVTGPDSYASERHAADAALAAGKAWVDAQG
jgi:hypothetical protein